MKAYAKIINMETKEVQKGVGCPDEYYKEIGMIEMDIEESYEGKWYVEGYAPKKPDPTVDELKQQTRSKRDDAINNIEWRIDRYKDQKELGIDTSDSPEAYKKILEYMQYLRDFTKLTEWWIKKVPTFEEWLKA